MINTSANYHILLAVVLFHLDLIHNLSLKLNGILLTENNCTNIGFRQSVTNSNQYNDMETDFELNNENHLFNIQRNKDSNKIIYEVNLDKNGELNQNNPINIYWIRHNKGGKRETLSMLEKRLAYGITYHKINSETTHFQFVSYSKKTLILKKQPDKKYKVFVDINGKQAALTKLFIHINGGTFMLPKISSVELHGLNVQDNKTTQEIIKP